MDKAQSVHNLIYSYAEYVDDGDFEAVGHLFARGSISFSPGRMTLHGEREVTRFYQGAVRLDPATGTTRTVHRVFNVILTETDSAVQARSRYEVSMHIEGQAPKIIATGRYFDSFRFEQGEPYFRHRKLVSEYLGDTREHLTETVTPVIQYPTERALSR